MDAKIWILLALLSIVSSRDLIVGSNNGGHKIYEENKQASPAIWRQTENVTIAAVDGEVITKVIITDLRDEKDGDVKIVEGGEGQQNVTVELKSPTVLRGYEFHIEAFAAANTEHTGLENENAKTLNTDETNTNTSPKVSTTTPTTSANPLSSSEIGKKQNREVEIKDKSTQQPMHPLSYTTTKTFNLQSTAIPIVSENTKDKEGLFPAIYGGLKEDTEPSKISENTANLASTKTVDANHNHQEDFAAKNYMLHTSVDYPKFYIHEINTAAPINNENLNKAVNDTKNESSRQKREVIEVKDTGKFKEDNRKHTSEKTETENTSTNIKTWEPRKIGNNKNVEHANHDHANEGTKYLAEEQNRLHTYKGRYIPQRFGFNEANEASESSVDISKTSTLSPTNTESKTFNDKTTQTDIVNIPQFTTNEMTTIKTEVTTANKEMFDKTGIIDQPATLKGNDRQKRDVMANKNGDKVNLKQLIENSSVSTTTLLPVIKNAATSDKNADAPSKMEIPVEIPSATTDKKDNSKTVADGNENKTSDGEVKSKTNDRPENKNEKLENVPTTEKQKNIIEPIGTKSEEKTSVTATMTEQNDRITRDTNTDKKADKIENENVSLTIESVETETENGAKKSNEKAEAKSVPVMIGDKNEAAVSTTESSPNLHGDSKNGTIAPSSDAEDESIKDQSPKLLREGQKVGLKDTKASLDLNNDNIALSVDSSITKDLSEVKLLKRSSVNI